jgi:pSer/pThr/pTyr-binding forkhead associated (FHA) protein
MEHTTTHDPRGGGHPRLIFALGDSARADAVQREFELLPGVTVIGSGADADLRLAGLGEHHAEVRRDKFDEYIYVDLGTSGGSRLDGTPVGSQALHTGDRIELGGLEGDDRPGPRAGHRPRRRRPHEERHQQDPR